MTTSYRLKALQELKANKKLEREKEAIEFKEKEGSHFSWRHWFVF